VRTVAKKQMLEAQRKENDELKVLVKRKNKKRKNEIQ